MNLQDRELRFVESSTSASALAPAPASRSASARHESPTAKSTVGCMSGIICFLSKYHLPNSSKSKLLTFGKRQNQVKKSRAVGDGSVTGEGGRRTKSKSSSKITKIQQQELTKSGGFAEDLRGGGVCNISVPRSPVLPEEVRRRPNSSSSCFAVARLMGLEEIPPPPPSEEIQPSRRGRYTRKQLLGALEKCDQDLKVLKRIIDAVQSAPKRMEAAVLGHYSSYGTRSPVSGNHHYYSNKQLSFNINNGRTQQRIKKLAGEEEEEYYNCYLSKNPSILDKFATETSAVRLHKKTNADNCYYEDMPLWHCERMMETVDQVCKDIAWGEKREMGKIGLAIQDQIYKDLIQELLAEMSQPYYSYIRVTSSLPFEACKRSLIF